MCWNTAAHVCIGKWVKGEGWPLLDTKCDIVFMETVNRQRDGCKYLVLGKYITITVAGGWNNIAFPFLLRENKLHCQYRFVRFHWRQWHFLSRISFRGGGLRQTWCGTGAPRGVIYSLITVLIFGAEAKTPGGGRGCAYVCLYTVYSAFVLVCVCVFGLGDLQVYCPHKEN